MCRKSVMKYLKRIFGAALAVVSAFVCPVKDIYALGDGVYYEKKDVYEIAEGLTYEKSRRLYSAGWMDVYVLTLDASASNLMLDVLESKDGLGLKKTVPALAQANEAVAAVNADFFGAGNPKSSMGQVARNGQMTAAQNYYNGSENKYAGFFVGNDGVPFIDYVKTTMGFYGSENAAMVMGAKNKVTDFSKPVYFDEKAISDTAFLDKNFSNLTKIVMQDNTIVKISQPGETVSVIPGNYIIVMNNATRQEKIGYYSVGMKVDFNENENFVFRPAKSVSEVKFGISGGGEILRNGEKVATGLIIGEKARNPRTMVGINKDKSKIYIVCIDGRTNGIGATHAEAANIMLEYGAYDAIHFDGGGSTTMVVKGNDSDNPSVVNVPSEGELRAVANAIGIKATGAEGVASMLRAYVADSDENYIFNGLENTINVSVYDGKLKMMSVDKSKLEFSANIPGEWQGNLFTPSSEGKGTITVKYGDLIDTLDVVVLRGVSAVKAVAGKYALEEGETTNLKASLINTDGYELSADPDDISWSVDDKDVGTVSNGVFTAEGEGVATVTARYLDKEGKLKIAVGKEKVAVSSLEYGRTMNVYASSTDISVQSGTTNEISYNGDNSVYLSYTFAPNMTTTQSAYMSFENRPIYLPDNTADVVFAYKGDGSGYVLKAVVKDGSGQTADVTAVNGIESGDWKQARFALPEGFTENVVLDKIYVSAYNTGSDNLSGKVYIDDIMALAPKGDGGSVEGKSSDYMNADLSKLSASEYESVSAYGTTSSSLSHDGLLSRMATGSRAMFFAGSTNISNNTGVASVKWEDKYYTSSTENISVVTLATGGKSLASVNKDQFRYLKDYVSNLSKENIVVITDLYIPKGIQDARERDALMDILSDAVHEKGKNIIVLSSVGQSDYCEVKDGVRYINLSGDRGSGQSFLKIMANKEQMFYEFQ